MPPKAAAAPKRTIDDVNREYGEKQAAWELRKQQLQQALQAAKDAADAARLELVAARENKVYYEARVVAEREQNESFENFVQEQNGEWTKKLRAARRKTKDGLFDVHYARDAASGVEKEVDQVQTALEELATDGTTSEAALEQEIDQLALTAAHLEAQRGALQRTVHKVRSLAQRMDRVRVQRAPRLESALQLTVIGCGGNVEKELSLSSVQHPMRVLARAEQALVRVCGFDVVERLVPDQSVVASLIRTAAANEIHKGALSQCWGQQVREACAQAATGSFGRLPTAGFSADTVDSTRAVILISCPITLNAQQQLCLVVSFLNEASRALLAELSEPQATVPFEDLIPLNDLLATVMSSGVRPFVSLVLDCWVDASVQSPVDCPGFCLYWHRATMHAPLLYQYLRHEPPNSSSQQPHPSLQHFLHLAVAEQARSLLLAMLSYIVDSCPNASTIDGATIASRLESELEPLTKSSAQKTPLLRRISSAADALGTPFSSLFLSVEQQRAVFHTMPLRLRPATFSSAHTGRLRVESRATQLVDTPLPNGYRWASRRVTQHSRALEQPYDEIQDAVFSKGGGAWESVEERLLDVTARSVVHAPWITKSLDLLVEDAVYDTSDDYILQTNKRRPINVDEINQKQALVLLQSDAAQWASVCSRRVQCAVATCDEKLRRAPSSDDGSRLEEEIRRTKAKWNVDAPLVSEQVVDRLGTYRLQLDGLRPSIDQRLVLCEIRLILDVEQANQTFGLSQQQSNETLEAIRATVGKWCEGLDISRPEQFMVRVVHHVRCFPLSSPFQVQVHIVLGALLTESATRAVLHDAERQHRAEILQDDLLHHDHVTLEVNSEMKVKGCTIDVVRYWLRSRFAEASGRWSRTAGGSLGSWRSCHLSNHIRVRASRLFHVLRDWRVNLVLEQGRDASVEVQCASIRRNVQLLQRLLLVEGGATGEPTLAPMVRVLDVRDYKQHKSLQLPTSFLNHFSESDINRWLQEEEGILPPSETASEILRSTVADRARQKAMDFRSAIRKNPQTFSDTPRMTIVLCWLVPCALRGIWHTCRSMEERRELAELPHHLAAIRKQFHRTTRVATTALGPETLITVLCTNLWVSDTGERQRHELRHGRHPVDKILSSWCRHVSHRPAVEEEEAEAVALRSSLKVEEESAAPPDSVAEPPSHAEQQSAEEPLPENDAPNDPVQEVAPAHDTDVNASPVQNEQPNLQLSLLLPHTYAMDRSTVLDLHESFPFPISFWKTVDMHNPSNLGLVALRFEGSRAARIATLPQRVSTTAKKSVKSDALKNTAVEQFVAQVVNDQTDEL